MNAFMAFGSVIPRRWAQAVAFCSGCIGRRRGLRRACSCRARLLLPRADAAHCV